MFARTTIRRRFRLTVQPSQNFVTYLLNCGQFGAGAIILTDVTYFGGDANATLSNSAKSYSSGQINIAGDNWSGTEGSQAYAVSQNGVNFITVDVDYDQIGGEPVIGVELDNPDGAIVQVVAIDLAIQINRLSDFVAGI